MDDAMRNLALSLEAGLGSRLCRAQIGFGELTVEIEPEALLPVLAALEQDFGFVSIVDICEFRLRDRPGDFELVYHLLSPGRNQRIRIKLPTGRDRGVASAAGLFAGARRYETAIRRRCGLAFHAAAEAGLTWH